MAPMIEMVTQREMERIFEVTDGLGIHRENLVVPLGAQRPGRVRRLANGKLEIVVDGADPEGFMAGLAAEIQKLG